MSRIEDGYRASFRCGFPKQISSLDFASTADVFAFRARPERRFRYGEAVVRTWSKQSAPIGEMVVKLGEYIDLENAFLAAMEKAPPLTVEEYRNHLASVPVPTPVQTAHFAQYVCEHHSWYKHLPPLPPGQRFTFFLDPHAGQNLQLASEGARMRDVGPENLFHHMDMRTTGYRERFGHWSYTHRANSPWIFVAEIGFGRRLPHVLVDACSSQFTSLLRAPFDFFMRRLDGRRAVANSFMQYVRAHPTDPLVELFAPWAGDLYGFLTAGSRFPWMRSFAVRRAQRTAARCAVHLDAVSLAQRRMVVSTLDRALRFIAGPKATSVYDAVSQEWAPASR